MIGRRGSLYRRLFISYLLVIGVGAAAVFLAGETFSPFFLERHVNGMMRAMSNLSSERMMQVMTTDLNRAYRTALSQSLLWAIVVSAVAASAVGLFVTRRIVTPLREMQRASLRIATGRYHDRLDTRAPGEIGDVAEAFNTMAEALERSEERRVELLGNVAHEFRTPLSSLRGYLEGLEDGYFEPDARVLGACKRQLSRLERLVSDLTLLSRVESGQESFERETLAAAELLEHAAAAFRPQFERKGVTLVTPAVDAALQITADRERTGQVLTNLLANALRHTPAGGTVTLRAQAASATEVRFEVRDSGEGIPAEALPHLFTRFYRADRSRARTDDSGGSGIGLTIAKHYVEHQGGSIGVNSEVGRGSTFWFTLPRAR